MPDLDPVDPPANPELDLDPSADDSTVGTGSVLAIGCSLVVFIILFVGIALFIARQID